jgi:hypothetical protein
MTLSISRDANVIAALSSLQSNLATQAASASDAIALQAQRCQDLRSAASRLGARAGQLGQPADAARIRDALARGAFLDTVFAADPSSLAATLADAQALADCLERSGIDAGQLLYPVLVSSSEAGKSTERLVWFSAAQRLALDRLSPSATTSIPGCPAFTETGSDGAVRSYCCIDACRTLRIPGTTVQELAGRVDAALRAAGSELQRMVCSFTGVALRSGQGLAELVTLMEAAAGKLGKRLEALHQECRDAALQADHERRQAQRRQQDRKRDEDRLLAQRAMRGKAGDEQR